MATFQRLIGVTAFGLAALTLAGCSPSTPPPDQLVGKTLEQTQESLGGPFIIIDITPNVVGKPSTYNYGNDPSLWSVLVACKADSGEGYVVGVIPKASETTAIVSSAKAGRYGSYVSGCSKE